MFNTRYFPARYFASRYWPKIGAESVEVIPPIITDAVNFVRTHADTINFLRTREDAIGF